MSRRTGVMSHVSINRKTSAAEPEKLFEEFVPKGVRFKVEIIATNVVEDDVRFLLAVLEHGAAHPTHPYHPKLLHADAWGRVKWCLDRIACVTKSAISLQSAFNGILPPAPREIRSIGADELAYRVVPHVAADLTLAFQGLFLVNDGSKAKPKDADEDDPRTNFTRASIPGRNRLAAGLVVPGRSAATCGVLAQVPGRDRDGRPRRSACQAPCGKRAHRTHFSAKRPGPQG